jgi:hypothetical protein
MSSIICDDLILLLTEQCNLYIVKMKKNGRSHLKHWSPISHLKKSESFGTNTFDGTSLKGHSVITFRQKFRPKSSHLSRQFS